MSLPPPMCPLPLPHTLSKQCSPRGNRTQLGELAILLLYATKLCISALLSLRRPLVEHWTREQQIKFLSPLAAEAGNEKSLDAHSLKTRESKPIWSHQSFGWHLWAYLMRPSSEKVPRRWRYFVNSSDKAVVKHFAVGWTTSSSVFVTLGEPERSLLGEDFDRFRLIAAT